MTESPTNAEQLTPGETSAPRFRLGRVLLVLVPLGTAVTAGLLGWGYFDVGQQIHRWLLPPLVPVTGQVYLNGEPLPKAQVFSRRVDVPGPNALAVTDEDGRFALRTDVDGDYLPGARLGEHLVVIRAPDLRVPSGPLDLLLITPPDCADFETTPLRMNVHRTPSDNEFTFRLEYIAPPPAAKPPPKPPANPPAGAGRGGPGKPRSGGSQPVGGPGEQPSFLDGGQ